MIDGRSGSTQLKYLFDTKFKCLAILFLYEASAGAVRGRQNKFLAHTMRMIFLCYFPLTVDRRLTRGVNPK